jgi:hypothetical protein
VRNAAFGVLRAYELLPVVGSRRQEVVALLNGER